MLLDWFNARESVQVGTSLANCFLPKIAAAAAGNGAARWAGNDVQKLLQQVTRDVRPLKLNVFKRAKLLGSFKWTLLEHGVDKSTVNDLTQLLLLQISGLPQVLASRDREVGSERTALRRLPQLLAEADTRFANGEFSEAVERLQEVLAIQPRNAPAHDKLGAVYVSLGNYLESEHEFRRAIELKPGFADAQLHLGTLLHMKGDFAASETPLRRAVKGNPRNPEALVGLGLTLALRNQMSDAKECFAKAQRLKPRDASVLCALGWVATVEGRFDDAEGLFRSALESNPRNTAAWAWLAGLRRMTVADKDWLEGVERVLTSGVPPHEESRLHFAMGKYFDDLGDFSHAFEQYKRGNTLYKQMIAPYDRKARTAFVDGMTGAYTKECLAKPTEGASQSDKPVLVTGMPRSGTSLVEQIIASHPSAVGAGELDFWSETTGRHAQLARAELADSVLISKLADSYLRTLARRSADALRVVDKSTFNADYLGPFHAVFPRARIIYLRRDPVDVCLSCYFQDFANGAPFAFDLADLAHYYREHHRLVSHWRSVVAPGARLEVPYEELVAAPEVWSRRIIEFIGLEWDSRCLDFHKTQRAVVTASNWQVRQQVYTRSVARWRNYQKFIKPLLELRDLA